MPDSDLYDLAADVLAMASAALSWNDRRFVSVGDPAYDCAPQLSVQVQRVEDAAVGPTGQASQGSMSRLAKGLGRVVWVTLQIDVVGCVPVGQMVAQSNTYKPPSAAALNECTLGTDR